MSEQGGYSVDELPNVWTARVIAAGEPRDEAAHAIALCASELRAATMFPTPGSVESVKQAIRVLTGHEAAHLGGGLGWDIPDALHLVDEAVLKLLEVLDERLPDGDAGVGDV